MNPRSKVDDSCSFCGWVACTCPQLDLFTSADRDWAERYEWE